VRGESADKGAATNHPVLHRGSGCDRIGAFIEGADMNLKTHPDTLTSADEIMKILKKYTNPHQKAAATWERDAKSALSLVAHSKSTMKTAAAKITGAHKTITAMWPKFEKAKQDWEEAKKAGDKKKIAAAEKVVKKLDNTIDKAMQAVSEGQGTYWGSATSVEIHTENLGLKLDSPY
jgi:uncharacterized NAD(P)/FAD-binding protein YdhS